MPTRPVNSCIFGEPDPALAAARGLQKLAVAHLAAAQRRQVDAITCPAAFATHNSCAVDVALGFLKELQDAAVRIGRDRIVLDEPQLRPAARL